jgi:hypothetical protein
MNIPVAGEPNRIFARVNNWGMKDQSNVVVRYWWANPSLAITEANAHLIGMTTTSVPAGYSVVTECPTKWIPVIENQGHECVLAEAFAPYWDPLVAPLEPVSDRHACQKNLHVIEVPVAKSFQLTLEVANITGDSQRVVLTASTLPFRMVREALYAPDIGYRKPLIETAGSVALKTSLSESGEFLKVGSKTFAQRLLAEDQVGIRAHQGLEVSPGSPILTTTFKPWELRRLTIEGRPESDTPGQAFGFEFREQIGNVITGGYRLYVVTV